MSNGLRDLGENAYYISSLEAYLSSQACKQVNKQMKQQQKNYETFLVENKLVRLVSAALPKVV